MRLAFVLFKYFPFGGLQRDAMAIAEACAERGHEIRFFVQDWQGPEPSFASVQRLPCQAWSNHGRARQFVAQLPAALAAAEVDRVIGFDKMPHLDVYYAADSCLAEKSAQEHSVFYRCTPRVRQFLALERAVFASDSNTQILLISAVEKQRYQSHYQTADSRMAVLPPGIRPDRRVPEDYRQQREAFRAEFTPDGQPLLLFVGSGFRTKGLDRAIPAFANLKRQSSYSNARFLIVGDDKTTPFEKQAKKLGVADSVQFLGGRDDVTRFFWGCDVLMHPAYRENTGTVLLEAMIAGLPVVTSEACGYAHYVAEANLGQAVALPFSQAAFEQAVGSALSLDRKDCLQRAQHFADHSDIYSMVPHAVSLIESWQERP